MNTRRLVLGTVSFAIAALSLMSTARAAIPTTAPTLTAGGFLITGPYTHENLSVFLIHGPDRLKGKDYLTLDEALAQKIVTVHETGNVNELSIENLSPDKEVYVSSGDIVKGGKQDRMIAQDFVVPPKSGKMPINAFCVEHGRWRQRGGEAVALFASSSNQVAGKELKLAARKARDQREVWQKVAENQEKLSANAGLSVADARSASSFELSLESRPVQEHTDEYIKALNSVIDDKHDVIGYAFAINGKINSADIYGNHALFAKLWPKLLRSSAVEAFAELQKGRTFAAPTTQPVAACIADAESGKASTEEVTPRVSIVTKETDKNVVFQTYDHDAPEASVRANYVAK